MSSAARLGVFVVAALLILAAGIFMIGDKQFLFSSTYRLKSEFPTVKGLVNGAEVRVGGVPKGSVRRILLPKQPDQEVTVLMDLETPTRDVIKKDSLATIETEGLLGNKFVSISFGSKEAGNVNDGDTVAAEPPLDISDMMKKTSDILDSSKTTVKNMGEATESLKSISAKIDQGKGTVGALINDKEVYRQLNETATKAKAGATAFGENMEALKHSWLLRGFFKSRGYADSSELTKDEISNLPQGPFLKKFIIDAQKLFAKPDTAELKNKKELRDVGQFLEQNQFSLAVVVAYAGTKGDSQKDLVLTQGRAMVVHDYLVDTFELDDTRIKTLGLGKNAPTEENAASRVEIIIYPVGLAVPPA